MKRVIAVMAVCASTAGFGAQAARADIVARSVITCQTTATWQITRGVTIHADVTLDPAPAAQPGCKNVRAAIADDLNASAETSNDDYPGYSGPYELVGPTVSGFPQFAGVAVERGKVFGPVVIASAGQLTATLSSEQLTDPPSAGGAAVGNIVQEHTPAGSCGPDCYLTKVTLTGLWNF